MNTITALTYYAHKFSRYLNQQALDIDTIKAKDIFDYLEQTRQKMRIAHIIASFHP